MFRMSSMHRFDTANASAGSSASIFVILADIVVAMSVLFIVRLPILVGIILLALLVRSQKPLKTPFGT